MTTWLVAALVATALTLFQYSVRTMRSAWAPAVLRWLSVLLVAALLLGARAGRSREPRPLLALDVSASWLRGGDSSGWKTAARQAPSSPGESVLLFGDSARPLSGSPVPRDRSSALRPVVDRALAAARPLVVITDGIIDDPEALSGLPAGSRVEIPPAASFSDVAVMRVDAPRSVVSGDTVEIAVTIAGGATPTGAGSVILRLGSSAIDTLPLGALPAFGERRIVARIAPPSAGAALLTAIARVPDDRESRNDSVTTVIEVTRSAAAVFVSTSPNEDSRFALSVLRGTLALPTRAYLQIAPGTWRLEGPMTPVTAAEVRTAAQNAPLAVLHGDTAVFGAPRALGRGALALLPTGIERGADWYAIAAPASPIMGTLAQLPWDSLPPLDVAASLPTGDWSALTVARSRQLERRSAIVGFEGARRVVIVGASGTWRWRFRGGASETAYSALWGSVFDWLAAGRFDARAAVPATQSVRSGERIAWHRGTGTDSIISVNLTRRGTPAAVATVTLYFGTAATTESAPLDAGIYEARTRGGTSLIAVNASRELLPRQPTVKSGPIGARATLAEAPRLRDYMWPFVLVLFTLCAEWLLRRRLGLR